MKIKVGLIGFGRMGRFYLKEMQKSGRWDVAYICEDVYKRQVVEHTELVPRVSAEYIAAPVEKHIGYIFADIRDKQGNNPDEKENLFGFIACPLYPCREERHIKI